MPIIRVTRKQIEEANKAREAAPCRRMGIFGYTTSSASV
jgi:hypothetical protein